MTKKTLDEWSKSLEECQRKVEDAFKEVCPKPSLWVEKENSDDIFDSEWNPIKMDPREVDQYSESSRDYFLNIANWYKTITGKHNHGTRLWKQLVKAHLVKLEPSYADLIDTIELKEDDAFLEMHHDYPAYRNQDSIVITVSFKKEIPDEKNDNIQTDSNTRIQLKSKLAEDLKLDESQISIKFSVRDPQQRFLKLKQKRLRTLENSFKQVNRLSDKKYYNFDGREAELHKIKKHILTLIEETIDLYEGRNAAEEFSRKVENIRDPY